MKNVVLSVLLLSVFLISCAAPQKRKAPVVVSTPPPVVAETPPPPIESLKLPLNARIRETDRGKILVPIPQIVHFYNAEINMMAGYKNSFQVARSILDMNPTVRLVLEGNANKLGPAYPYNYFLSVRRSDASFKYLQSIGSDTNRLLKSALGEALPEYPTLAENRRLEFIIIENDEELIKYNDFVKNVDIRAETK